MKPGDPVRVGAYEIVGRLGAGGMGVVYLARAESGRLVAVKVVHATLAHDDEFRLRFRSEVARARQVPPFCTAEVLDADPEATQPYLVVEYVDGPTLAAEVKAKGPLTSSNLHAVAVGIATALTVIHEAGVIHRDLKPANVLLAPGSPKVIDFGIARALEAAPTQYTRSGQVMGTINYMAPERFDETGDPATTAGDVFAWGCVVAFAGTGRAPFAADTPMATLAKILTQPPQLDGLADGPLRRLVARALDSDPAKRPTARELLTALLGSGPAGALDEQPELREASAAARAPGVRDKGSRALLSTVVVLLLVLLGGAGFIGYRMSGLHEPVSAAPVALDRHGSPSPSPSVSSKPGRANVTKPSSSPGPTARPPAGTVRPSPTDARPTSKAAATATARATVGPGNQPPLKTADVVRAGIYGPYSLYNLATGMCADLQDFAGGAPDQPVYQYLCAKSRDDNQEFSFVPHGTDAGGNQLYWIRNVDDNLCVDVPGTGVVEAATEIIEMTCNEQDNQDYRLQPRLTSGGRQYYWLINSVSGMCLDVYGEADGGQAAHLTLVECVPGDDHEWSLVEMSDW